jgi:hypothetical protein
VANQFGGMKVDDAKRLKELEWDNARLKKMVAEARIIDLTVIVLFGVNADSLYVRVSCGVIPWR